MENPIKMDDLGYPYFRKHPYHLCTLDYLQAGFINMGQELSVLRHYLASAKCLDFIEDPAGSLVDLLNGLMFIFFYVSFLGTSKVHSVCLTFPPPESELFLYDESMFLRLG